MAKVKFVLKEPKSAKPNPILALVRFNNKRVKYSIGYSLDPVLWDDDYRNAINDNRHSRLKELKIKLSRLQIQYAEDINNRIENIRVRVNDIFRNFDYYKITPTTKNVKEALDVEFRPSAQIEEIDINLNKFIDQFIKDIESGNRLTGIKQTRYSPGTVKIYKGFQSMFDEYQNDRNIVLDYEDIDMDFYRDYVKFFRKKDYSTNTIGRHIKTLKMIMGASERKKLHTNNQYNQSDFRGLTEKVDNIYLNLEELEKIYKLKLEKNPEWIAARDVFLVGCFTALRYSDYSRIGPQHIQELPSGKRIIRIITKKTKEEVLIPFWHWILEELIDKYPDGMPKTHEQKVNERIKKIGKMAKIVEKVNKLTYKDGLRLEVSTAKCNLIKTHTARRSGATNMYKQKIPTVDIMKITGHTLESNFFKYIKVTKEETAERIATEFRINKPLKVVN